VAEATTARVEQVQQFWVGCLKCGWEYPDWVEFLGEAESIADAHRCDPEPDGFGPIGEGGAGA